MVKHDSRCGECTACCITLPVDALSKPANEMCVHCDGGCTIYEDRPQDCSLFECAYLQSTAQIELRPDNCGIIFEKLTDKIFFGTVFKQPTKAAVEQVHSFIDQGFSVVLVSNIKRFPLKIHVAPGHDEGEIRSELFEYLEERS